MALPTVASTTSASCLFFFSSRRRHTRFSRDWSSDVCSSDLADAPQDFEHALAALATGGALAAGFVLREGEEVLGDVDHAVVFVHDDHAAEIGRASCRERVLISVVGGVLVQMRREMRGQY